ncbi:MAG: hypothetical protein E7256_14840 [Lachnospiraceae bacterium]|nr:hypothetical protein [Lachnospiraceae bacterium]
MSILKKICITLLSIVLVVLLGKGGYYLIHYVWYDDYKEAINKEYEYEEGTKFEPIKEDHADVEGMVLAAESDSLKLYTNLKTAEVAIYDKRNGQISYSNPPDADNDGVASAVNKSTLKSQISLIYYNTSKTAGSYNSYDYSVSLGQFTCEKIENGLRYVYTIGDLSSATGIVPTYISAERLYSFTDKLDEKESKYITTKYMESDVKEGFLQLNDASKKGAATLRKLNKYLEEAGYTMEDYEADMEASGVEGAVPISFEVPLEYRLEDDGLVVNVPTKEIKENGGGLISWLQVLNYFGAASETEQGYMVVPNGSGSLIYFNNGKTTAADYSQYMYDMDPANMDAIKIENTEQPRMPVFGIARENSGIFAVVEKGESFLNLNACVAGKITSYNNVYPSFLLRTFNRLVMSGSTGSENSIPVFEPNLYDVDLTIRYSFLTDEYKGYSGMASYYREKLIKEGALTKQKKTGDIPFYMDLLGGVKRTAFFLGKQYLQVYPMTTFKEAEKITDSLAEDGIHNLVVNYQGWFNGGYYHDVADKIKVVSKLGSKSDLEALTKKVEDLGGKLYGDVAFQEVSFISKRFDYMKETARYYGTGQLIVFGQVSPATLTATHSLGYQETLYDLISPKFLPRYVEKFSNKIKKYDITGISLRDLGDVLQSDKKKTEFIDREAAKQVVEAQYQTLKDTGKDIMTSGGNAYSLAYTDDLINIPTSYNPFFIVDEEIPFYEMVIHGCIDYAGKALNLSSTYDETDVVLRMIEYGAAPHFTFSYEESSELKYTGLNMDYSTTFSAWEDIAKSVYGKVNEALSYVSGAQMVGHEILAEGVKKVTYSNGVVIYINTTEQDYLDESGTVSARSYRLEEIEK